MKHQDVSNCRICQSKNLSFLFDIGNQVITGVFLKPEEQDPTAVPLEMMICNDCNFVQLSKSVNPDDMYARYWYRSGTNKTMTDHLASIVSDAIPKIDVEKGDIVIDIGCNDGTLLKNYDAAIFQRIGVDPSNAVEFITDNSINVVNNYFAFENVKEALNGKKAKIITSISMFYDLNDPKSFILDIKNSLHKDGIWIIEMNYTGDLLSKLGYDMIGHEHVGYYTLAVFDALVRSCGLHVQDASFNDINGGTIRIFVGFEDKKTAAVARILADEKDRRMDSSETYINYGKKVNEFKDKLLQYLKEIVKQGKKIGIYGASTRGNTILQHCGIGKDLVFAASERNSLKWGLETPGTRIPMISEEEMRKISPEYLLVLPYHFIDEFVQREEEYLKSGGRFIVPMPILREIYFNTTTNKIDKKII